MDDGVVIESSQDRARKWLTRRNGEQRREVLTTTKMATRGADGKQQEGRIRISVYVALHQETWTFNAQNTVGRRCGTRACGSR